MAFFNELVGQAGMAAGTEANILSGNNETTFTSTGTTQATAVPLTSSNATLFSSTANAAYILPNDAGIVTIFNNSIGSAVIFPAVGFNINAGAVNAGFTLPSLKSALFFTYSTGGGYGNWAVILSA